MCLTIGWASVKSSTDDEMKCPKCYRFGLKETEKGIVCKTCGYTLNPGQTDKFRLYRMLREESKSK